MYEKEYRQCQIYPLGVTQSRRPAREDHHVEAYMVSFSSLKGRRVPRRAKEKVPQCVSGRKTELGEGGLLSSIEEIATITLIELTINIE